MLTFVTITNYSHVYKATYFTIDAILAKKPAALDLKLGTAIYNVRPGAMATTINVYSCT